MNNYFERVRTLLNVYNQDELIFEIIEIIKEKVLMYLNLDEVPYSLEWIIVELSVSRFNRIGSEGMSSESVDGGSTAYITDELLQYKAYLDDYLIHSPSNRKKGYKLF